MVGGARTTFGFFVGPTPAPGTIRDHSIGAKVLVAVQGPWRLSAHADRKTLTDTYLDYTHTVTFVTDGEVQRGRYRRIGAALAHGPVLYIVKSENFSLKSENEVKTKSNVE